MHYDPILCMNVPDKVTAKDAAVNEYEIHYTVPGKSQTMVGSGKGSTEAEAKADFLSYHKSENPKITSVKFYKKVSDSSKTIDQAIKVTDYAVHFLFYRDIDGDVVTEKFYDIGKMRSREDQLRRHDITKMREWTHAEWAKSDFNKLFNKMKNSI